MSDKCKSHGGKPIEFCGDQEGWIAVASLSDDSPLSPCYPSVVLLGMGLGESGKMHPSNIAAMLTIEQATDLRERLTAAMTVDRPAPAPAPGLDLDAAEKRAAGFRGAFRAMSYDSGDELLEFVALDRDIGDDVSDIDEIAQFACDGETQRAIVATLNAAPALIAEVRALRAENLNLHPDLDAARALLATAIAKLAEAKRLGLEACAFVHSAIDNAPDPTSNDPGDQSAIAAGHSVTDRIAAALEAL